MTFAPIVLKKRHERRIVKGHPWVFSNEIDTDKTPLTQFEAGQSVEIRNHSGKTLGSGYVNPATLIAVRLLGTGRELLLDEALIESRLRQALALRERLYDAPYYRLVYAESDALPGVVIDRYDRQLVVQLTTAGAERARHALLDVLTRVLSPECIVLKNDLWARKLEGLSQIDETVLGQLPPELSIREGELCFSAPLSQGQKTGWYYDQRPTRTRVGVYARARSVLDVCSYVGGFGVNAAHAGASAVTFIDSSATALAFALRNGRANAKLTEFETLQGDMFDLLKSLGDEQRSFDLVIVDPPALIPRRKDLKNGRQAYLRLNRLALRLLKPGAILVTASCSFHFPRALLAQTLSDAARIENKTLQILEQGYQGPDHPIHYAMAETEYLKTMIARVIDC